MDSFGSGGCGSGNGNGNGNGEGYINGTDQPGLAVSLQQVAGSYEDIKSNMLAKAVQVLDGDDDPHFRDVSSDSGSDFGEVSLRLKGIFSTLLAFYLMWIAALESSGVLQHITTSILISALL